MMWSAYEILLKWWPIRTYTARTRNYNGFDIPFRAGIEERDFSTVYQNMQHAGDDV